MRILPAIAGGLVAAAALATTPALAQVVYGNGYGYAPQFQAAPYGYSNDFGYGAPVYGTPSYSGRSVYRSYREFRRSTDNDYN